jgi:hypothetical protein
VSGRGVNPDQIGERTRRLDRIADAVTGAQTCELVDPGVCFGPDGWFEVIPDPPDTAAVWDFASGRADCPVTREELRLALRAAEAFGGFQWDAMAQRWGLRS